jgi:hypothetical protein
MGSISLKSLHVTCKGAAMASCWPVLPGGRNQTRVQEKRVLRSAVADFQLFPENPAFFP